MTRSEVPAEFRTGPTSSPTPAVDGIDVFDSKPRDHATRRQVEYLRDLLASRELPATAREMMEARVKAALAGDFANGVSFDRASDFIGRLIILPKTKVPVANSTGVRVEFLQVKLDGDKEPREVGQIVLPDGRKLLAGSYGIDTSEDDRFTNDTSFFKVWTGREYGKGWGVKLYVSDYTHRVKLNPDTEADAIKSILDAGPDAAARLFGLEFKRCGVCHRGLTNDLSRELGIGPVCRGRLEI